VTHGRLSWATKGAKVPPFKLKSRSGNPDKEVNQWQKRNTGKRG